MMNRVHSSPDAPHDALVDNASANTGSSLKNRLKKHFATGAKAAAAVAGLAAAGSMSAAVVTWTGSQLIPVNTTGVYVIVEGPVFNTLGSMTGWDINPWASSSLSWFNNSAIAGGSMIRLAGGTGTSNLPLGFTIGASGPWNTGGAAPTTGVGAVNLSSNNNYFGFRFLHNTTGLLHYGYCRVVLGATVTTATRALIEIHYESVANTPITIPSPTPTITYSPLANTCTLGARTLSANITDPDGVPIAGAGLPRLYWRINAGAYTAATGTFISGSQYDFSFGAGAVASDAVSYYIVAQDNLGNVIASPSAGAGGYSINPPAASTPPTTPSSYTILTTLAGGTYAIPGAYATLTAAVAAYNGGCAGGPIVFELQPGYTSGTETFPITINANSGASAINTLTIRPAIGATPNISGNNATALIKLNGADYVTFDGSPTGATSADIIGGNAALRSLTLTNAGAGPIFWIGTDAISGATNNRIRNLNMVGPGAFTGQGVIAGSGATFGSPAESGRPNSNNTVDNCSAVRVQNAVFASGDATTLDANWTITRNSFGSATVADKLSFRGMLIGGAQNMNVSLNAISGVSSSTGTTATMSGIMVAGVISGGSITRNEIKDIRHNNTGGWGSCGLNLAASSTASNLLIANNFISAVASTGFNGFASADNGNGIVVETGGGYNIWNNTVSMNVNQAPGTTGQTAAVNIISTATAGGVNLRNNILSNTQTVGTRWGIVVGGTNAVFAAGGSNYNDYFAQNVGRVNTVAQPTLANYQAATAQDANSIAVDPTFTSVTDFHIPTTSPCFAAGTTIGAVTNDYDGDTRPQGLSYDIGADEALYTCVAASVGGPQTICELGTTAPLGGNLTGSWSIFGPGTGNFLPNNTTANATFQHLTGTGSITLRWTRNQADCAVTTADVVVTLTAPSIWYADTDGDGQGAGASTGTSCTPPNAGDVTNNTDPCPNDATNDGDGDGVCEDLDNCPGLANPSQANADGDALGDACDACPNDATNDGDGDGVCEDLDNCPGLANPSQANFDGDSQGDACDPDDDNDGLSDVDEGTAGTNPFDEDTDDDGFLDGADNCPLVTGVVGSICDANPNPLVFLLGELDITCNCVAAPCTQNLVIDFKTDANPGEIGWELREQGTNTLVQQGLPGSIPAPNSPSYLVNTCVPNGCYYLKVTDTGGNGITNGGYVLRTGAVIPGSLPANMRIIDNRNNFTSGGTSQIQGPAPADGDFCFNGSSANLTQGIYTSCDKMDWVTGLYYVCSPVPAVAAQWNAGNTPAEAISGYEFWIYNPNGGYSFRRFRSHNVSDGFAPDNASRACHMKINNWAAANQIPANVLMNVRVRSRVNGTYYNWGPACRFMINPTQAACPLTNLMDIPGDPNLSCNSTRAWGNGNYIYARPVSGATQYQWRFRIDAENFVAIRTTTTYFIQLNWATLPLQDGKTYDVEVRAFKGGAWCIDTPTPAPGPNFTPWNPNKACLLTIDNTPFDGGDENSLEAGQSGQSEGLRMYPNPNRGDQLYLTLDAVEEGVSTVSVDISDMFGKRVSARTIAVTDTFINTVLDLDGDMANGMYLVHITAGDKRYTERLVIQK